MTRSKHILVTTNGWGDNCTIHFINHEHAYTRLHPSKAVAEKYAKYLAAVGCWEIVFPWEVYNNKPDNPFKF